MGAITATHTPAKLSTELRERLVVFDPAVIVLACTIGSNLSVFPVSPSLPPFRRCLETPMISRAFSSVASMLKQSVMYTTSYYDVSIAGRVSYTSYRRVSVRSTSRPQSSLANTTLYTARPRASNYRYVKLVFRALRNCIGVGLL